MINRFSIYVVPVIVLIIVIFGLYKKLPIFDLFLSGAKDGIKSTLSIAPAIIGLITAVTMLTASGAFDLLSNFLYPMTNFLKIPAEVVPLIFLRPVSGSGALALVDSIFGNVGPDSLAGRIVSILMSSTETTFYAITVYFGSVGVKNIKYAVKCALIIDLIGFILSIVSSKIFFK